MTSRLYLTASVAPLVRPCFRALMYSLAALQGGSSRLIPGLLRLMCLLLTSTGGPFLGAGRHSCCSLDPQRSGERAARHVGFPRDIGLLYCDNTDATSIAKYFLWTSPCGLLIYNRVTSDSDCSRSVAFHGTEKKMKREGPSITTKLYYSRIHTAAHAAENCMTNQCSNTIATLYDIPG